MDIDEIHVGERYTTAAGLAVVTGIDREKNKIQVQGLEEFDPAITSMQLGYPIWHNHELTAEQIYESLADAD